jgi:hypothetical protein
LGNTKRAGIEPEQQVPGMFAEVLQQAFVGFHRQAQAVVVQLASSDPGRLQCRGGCHAELFGMAQVLQQRRDGG